MPLSTRNRSAPDSVLTSCVNCCCCLGLTFATAGLLASLAFVLNRSQFTLPAICQEGRLADPLASHPRVAIDVPSADGVNSIECLMPIAVYSHGDLGQPARDNLRQSGVTGPESIPYEDHQSGVECIPRNASVFAHINNVITLSFIKKCDDEWDCNHGKCDAHEKALRVCLSRVVTEPYKCLYIQDKPEWGVTTNEKQTTQITSLIVHIVLMFLLSTLFVIYDDEDSPCNVKFDTWRAYLTATMLLSGAFIAYLHCIHLKTALPPPLLRTAMDLTEPCTIGEFHMCAAPLPEEPPWNHTMSPVLYYTMHFLLFWVPICCWGTAMYYYHFYRRSSNTNEHTPLV